MKKQSILTFSLALLLVGNIFAQKKQWTLQECVELALENNISIKQNQLEYASAELDKLSAMANFLPSVNANANHLEYRVESKYHHWTFRECNYSVLFCRSQFRR